ncbi:MULTISPECIES: substrate-binding domain-containing protein [unclassified Sphingomonas]|uniref:substrate-binding domain-containing protein n=1 Tax=unclassified Sphingomonas TaxID=196159 RepID=UPI00082CF4B7|nr:MULTISPECIES: substrate-binding domain-containing protein [unclassified Sphingomonas]MCH4893910.1 phosphate ABC transporter substrate-binding protein [Sphingomonas sp. SFZ2018-12]
MTSRLAIVAASSLLLVSCDQGAARDQIKVVGSSTVYPFTTIVAEQLVNNNPNLKAPVIESTGTGAGIKLFCAGVGSQHPDILNASRRLYASELQNCTENGVTGVMEVQVGTDGVALAESLQGPKLSLTKKDIYLALAANPMGQPNTRRTWRDVNPALPALPIQVFGPPSTSGTRDAFVELILAPGCEEAYPEAAAIKKGPDPDRYANVCTRIRDDAAYVDKGENDNLIVQNLSTNPNAIGIFGFSYLEENDDRLRGVPIDGVEPTYQTIATNRYPGARPLFIYVKKQHIRPIPGMRAFLEAYANAWAPDGPLVKRGMIAASTNVRFNSKNIIDNEITLKPEDLN